jgi:dTDP-4-dehydrorhamnose reductase
MVTPRPLLITGATGTLGCAFARICDIRGLPYRLTTRQELEIAVPSSAEAILNDLQPWAVINTAGYVRVDDAEQEPAACERENTTGPVVLAEACTARNLPFVTFSSDLVFDGRTRRPYVECDPVMPLNVYGRTKAAAETRVLAVHPEALVIRTSAFIGPWDEHNFVTVCLRELRSGRPFIAASDCTVSPTYVPDLVNSTLDLLIDGERGLWHLANVGAVTWADLARQAARLAELDIALIESRSVAELNWPAPRPAYSVLGSERGMVMPTLDDALARYFTERDAG